MNNKINLNSKTQLAPAPSLVRPALGLGLVNPAALLLEDTKKDTTRRAYAAALRHFFAFAGVVDEGGGKDPASKKDPSSAQVQEFLGQSVPELALVLAQYKNSMRAAGLSSASVNQRLAAIRSLMKLSHRLGFCATDGRGLIDSEKVEPYRDTRGTDHANIKRLLALPDTATLRGKRDAALLHLLCVEALRRAEVCSLDVQHFNGGEGRLDILGKGETDRREISLPSRCTQAIRTYLAAAGHAGDGAAPLIRNCDRNPSTAGRRLTPGGLYQVVGGYGKQIGLKLAPHKLRHSAITIFLNDGDGNILEAQGLSRHKDIRTLSKYDDNLKDRGGKARKRLEELLYE